MQECGDVTAKESTSPNELLACESDIDPDTDIEGSVITSSTLNEVRQDAPSDFWMAISALWGVFADVGGYWQSVSLCVVLSSSKSDRSFFLRQASLDSHRSSADPT